MSELDELVQDIEKFKQNVAQSNELFDKLDASIEETKKVSANQAQLKEDYEDLSTKTEQDIVKNNDAIKNLENKIDEIQKQNKKTNKLLLVVSGIGAALGLVAVILAIILFIK
jgi:uncharacterized membrane protein YjjP (DUF1212 family)